MRCQNFALAMLTAALATAALSGCTTYHDAIAYIRSDKEALCPDVAILANTASLPAFDPKRGEDPSALVYSIAMTDVKTRCDYSKREFTADARVKIFFTATRPPGGDEATYRVPYFVAVTNEGEIVDKQAHWLDFSFPKGAPQVSGTAAVDSMEVQVDRKKKPYEYHLIVGFQLTKTQLDYNKTIGQYIP